MRQNRSYLCYQEGSWLACHMVATAQLRFVFLITLMSTSNTASGSGISTLLAVTKDRVCEKDVLSFHTKNSDKSVGTGSLHELSW